MKKICNGDIPNCGHGARSLGCTNIIYFVSFLICICISVLGCYCNTCWLVFARHLDELHVSWGHPTEYELLLQSDWLYRTPYVLFVFPVIQAVAVISNIRFQQSRCFWLVCVVVPCVAFIFCIFIAIRPISIGI